MEKRLEPMNNASVATYTRREARNGVLIGFRYGRDVKAPNVQAVPTAGAGVSVETGRRVKVTESIADRAVPAVDTSALFGLAWLILRQ